ncbi:MAG: SMC family ATPase [Cyanobacteria bacterium]|nr:SMC family ATPase [Cyanobacteriota bacterium]MDW8201009.1 SMC family ATPase [Cyanobacteriota bacterium SKYGB_h_bin112]
MVQILSVTLKNFKCHADRYFEFQPGFNAIIGENGAGKSSILEAIAWVLFDHSDYTKDELIRRGAKTATAAVEFISRADGRTYRVERSTSTGYRITDPQLRHTLELSRIAEEVTPWLKQQLGVTSTIKLPDLFATMVGIPQGTFTADFLKRPKERKDVFNPLLKVEDYEQAATQSRELEKLAEAGVNELIVKIQHYSDRLQDWDDLKQQHLQLQTAIHQDQVRLAALNTELESLTQEKAQLDAIVADLQQLEQTIQGLNAQITAQQQTVNLWQQAMASAQAAVTICASHQADYEAFLAADTALAALNRDAQTRQQLLTQRDSVQSQLDASRQEILRLQVQLEELHQAENELQHLEPLVVQQATLEQEQGTIAAHLQQIADYRREYDALQQHQQQLLTRLTHCQQTIQRLEAWKSEIAAIPDWEQHRDRTQQHLSRLAVACQFQAELQQLVQPALQDRTLMQIDVDKALAILQDLQESLPLYREPIAATILTLQRGQTLTNTLIAGLEQILADLAQQTSEADLQQQLQTVNQQLHQAYQQQAEVATLPAYQTQLTDLQTELERCQIRLTELTSCLDSATDWQRQQATVSDALAKLDNPRGRSQLLTRRLQQKPQLQASYTQLQESQTAIQQQYDRLTEQLQPFANLDAAIAEQADRRQAHQSGYTIYIQHQSQADRITEVEQTLQAAIEHLATLQTQQAEAQQAWQRRNQACDHKRLAELEAAITTALATKHQITGRLPLQQQQLDQVTLQLAERETLAAERDQAQQALAKRQQTYAFIKYARSVYKQAGPRITRFYLGEISREADRLFRELMNRQNLALDWTEDYEIRVQEGAYWRNFRALSGGEQMCAALAVRLALLKVLADIDIAFFDEPTTNMDSQRRQHLAEALTRLKTFQQLIVISHDDTFENLTENVVKVDRQ